MKVIIATSDADQRRNKRAVNRGSTKPTTQPPGKKGSEAPVTNDSETLLAKFAALENTVVEQYAQLTALREENAELRRFLLDESQADQSFDTVFRIGTQRYRFTVRAFLFEGQRHISRTAVKDAALLKRLVALGAGFIEPLK